MRVRAIFFVAFGLLKLVCAQTLPIHFRESAPVLDGELAEWDDAAFASYRPDVACPSCANTLRYQMGYDETYLYAAIEVRDKRLMSLEHGKGNARLYFNDCIEFYFDPLHNSSSMMDADDLQFIVVPGGDWVAFRGGDKYRIVVDSATVPKDTSTHLMIVHFAGDWKGTLNDSTDVDSGYTLELQWPWANMGVEPQKGMKMRMDICMNDLDTLVPDLSKVDTLWYYYNNNISGKTDFGYPNDWVEAELTGEGSWYYRFTRTFSPWWWAFALGAILLLSPWLITLIIRNRQLRLIPERSGAEAQPVVQAAANAPAEARPEWVNKARFYILAQLDDDTRPENLATELGVSERQLQRMFREELDTTPHAFITLVKLEQAAILLRNGKTSVKEVAYAVGFTDPGYFARVFKKYYNESPSQMLGKS